MRIYEFPCSHCNKKLSSKYAFDHHIKIHLGCRPDRCDKCGKRFVSKHRLQQHMRTHNSIKHICICNICGEGFRTSGAVRSHWFTHTGEYHCDYRECRMHFELQEELDDHKKNEHSIQQTMFQCDICMKSLKSKVTYLNHIEMHKRKHRCQKCNQQFSSTIWLQIHSAKNSCLSKDTVTTFDGTTSSTLTFVQSEGSSTQSSCLSLPT